MKLLVNGDNIIVFLSKKKMDNESFEDEDAKDFLKKIIKRLENYYCVELCGYYNVNVHIDSNYGAILEFEKENLEYFEYYEGQIDLNVKVEYEKFLYEVEDFNYFNKQYNFYKSKDKFYLNIDNVSDIELGQILEYSKIVYGEKALKIEEKMA